MLFRFGGYIGIEKTTTLRKAEIWVSMTLDRFTGLYLSFYMWLLNCCKILWERHKHFETFIAILLIGTSVLKFRRLFKLYLESPNLSDWLFWNLKMLYILSAFTDSYFSDSWETLVTISPVSGVTVLTTVAGDRSCMNCVWDRRLEK